MSLPIKICPICGTPAHPNVTLCSICGTTLTDMRAASVEDQAEPPTLQYNPRYGETDLFEGDLQRTGKLYLTGAILAMAVILCGAGTLVFGSLLSSSNNASSTRAPNVTDGPTIVPPQQSQLVASEPALLTNTPRPTGFLVTVTPLPPSTTATGTPEPCIQQVLPGDDLNSILYRCGHRSLDVLEMVMELNELTDPNFIVEGQTLIVPWPTPTPDPNLAITEEATPEADASQDTAADSSVSLTSGLNPQEPEVMPTETLQAGVTWHRVRLNENIIIIADIYGASVEILSQLNPEVTFSQCDFGQTYGGPNCIVQIFEGQRIRVPAPTPTPTLPPTPSGSETPTPTVTATFNAPSLISPHDRAFFRREELITLRWVASGTLAPGQTYRVLVNDLTSGVAYTADTQEIFFIVPELWQGQDGQRHTYRWRVSVIDMANPSNPYYTTEARSFVWEGREENI